jgi:hypothetical protein
VTYSTVRHTLPPPPRGWGSDSELADLAWRHVPTLPPFRLHDGSGLAIHQTEARACADAQALYVRFDCQDPHIWGTYRRRDQPIYEEEVVELMLAPGTAAPTRYFEFEVSPNGVLFDAEILNPTSLRQDIKVMTEWDCAGVRWCAERSDTQGWWAAMLAIPWKAISPAGEETPAIWRANFYRIERPVDGPPEFSCWSPTMAQPADFHRPARFGTLLRPS